jgi:NAD(P)-dependent dehydrogenase (short-subunit alcohol dehydrogenase family)
VAEQKPAARSVVITGASRGLGLASAAQLYKRGWHVLAAMRAPDDGMPRLYAETGAAPGDPRLTPITLDLLDHQSIVNAAKAITDAVGSPDALVHNAAFVAVGTVEEMPADVMEQVFTTNVLGPIRLTSELLPSMRAAGRGRVVVVCSQGGVRGMPTISAYSATKGAIERWAESLAHEVAPFGLGVTVLLAGTFRTDILTETQRYTDPDGPYAPLHAALDRTGEFVVGAARSPQLFAAKLAKALETDTAPLTRHPVGPDAWAVLIGSWALPGRAFRAAVRVATRIPKPNAFRAGHGRPGS